MNIIQYGELVRHFDDDEYQLHAPATVDLNEMTADVEDNGKYWVPDDGIVNLRNFECWDEIVLDDGTSYPAVLDIDDDGYDHMHDRYGEGNFIVWSECD